MDDEFFIDDDGDFDVWYYVVLGLDNFWYMFIVRSVKSVYMNLVNFGEFGKFVEELLKEKL